MAAAQTADPAEALLRRLWLEDGQSFKQIAEALTALTGRTVTRSAVSGRIRRLGLTGMQAPPAEAAPPPPAAGEGGAEAVLDMPISEQDQQVEPASEVQVEAAPTFAPGTWPMAATLPGQCKFACTPHSARPEQHRFCGEPVAWKGGKPTSWCRVHLDVVSGAPGRTPGGASVADVTNGQARPDREPARSGWGAIGA